MSDDQLPSQLHNSAGNDDFESITIAWIEQPTFRDERRFLETHLELLDHQTITILESLLQSQSVQDGQAVEQFHDNKHIIDDAIARGKTAEAVRDAYVNVHGGFTLELPMWLGHEIAAIDVLEGEAAPDRSATARARRWEDAYQRAHHEQTDLPITAEISVNVAYALSDVSDGRRAQSQEQSIIWYERALLTYSEAHYPRQWAAMQINLGSIYRQRIVGEKRENRERAIAFFNAALHIYTKDRLPLDWAMTQVNLGNVYVGRIAGEKSANQEQAIVCYSAALHVFTEERMPLQWARLQNNLGAVYRERLAGEKSFNQEEAIACYTASLRVHTEDRLPQQWATTQNNLGNVYRERIAKEREVNQKQAISCYTAALSVRTEDRLPSEHRMTARILADYFCTLGHWEDALTWYARARGAETLLLAFAATVRDQDTLLNDGREAITREAYAQVQLGQHMKALVVLEQGRARTLAVARAQAAADPARIRDLQRRARYLTARTRLQSARRTAYLPLDLRLDEQARRTITLQQAAAINEARAAFDACLKEIAEAHDPDEFLSTEVNASIFADALARCPAEHAIIYLLATPWGGTALAACAPTPSLKTVERITSYDLPHLTESIVQNLLEDEIPDGSRRIISGLAWGQAGSAFQRFCRRDWSGTTFRQRAASLHDACNHVERTGSFNAAAQAIIIDPVFAEVIDTPLDALDQSSPPQMLSTMESMFNSLILQHEIQRTLATLGYGAIRPLANWLREQGVTGVTLIPCGALATFPLLSVPIEWMQPTDGSGYWRTFADCFVNGASVAPSVRALIPTGHAQHQRNGLRGIGNPAHSGGAPLEWGEAEARTLAELTGDPHVVRIGYLATRASVIADLKEAWIYEASCHGNGGNGDFLDYGLFLANAERLTLRDIFSGEITDLHGLRLFILSACQTGIIDLRGARDEVRSLAVGLLQAGCEAVLVTQWSVNQFTTYLLIVRFFQIWQGSEFKDPPTKALAEAQRWLRCVTWSELRTWQGARALTTTGGTKYITERAEAITQGYGHWSGHDPHEGPYAHPFYWAGFAINGW